jgi:serine/threonine protein kinase
MPFHAESALSLNRRICEQVVDFDTPQWASVSAAGIAFVQRMLTRDVDARPSAEALLGDAWITQSRPYTLAANLPQMRALISNRRRWRQSIHAVRAVNILTSPQAVSTSRLARLGTIASASLIDAGNDAEPPQSSDDAGPEPLLDAGDEAGAALPRGSDGAGAELEPLLDAGDEADAEPQRSSGESALPRGSDGADAAPRPR